MVLMRLEANTCRFRSAACQSLANWARVRMSWSLFLRVMNRLACTASANSFSSGSWNWRLAR